MQVTRNVLNISDIYRRFKDGTLTVNKSYQRSSKLWPLPSRSYFIDTILNGFPFPKITIRQLLDTNTLETKQEIVDGQQRIGTIVDFLENNLRLTTTSELFQGMRFDDLEDSDKGGFLAYEVSVDTIIQASDEEVIDTFRRMNSYMLPLNKPELRYSQYQGEFKWFIAAMEEKYSSFFQDAGILSLRDVSRMKDTELITECAQVVLTGVQNKSDKALNNLYKDNDKAFAKRDICGSQMQKGFDFIKDELFSAYHDGLMNGFLFYSLFSALQYNCYGPASEEDRIDGLVPQGTYCNDPIVASQLIRDMLSEVEARRQLRKNHEPVDNSTPYAEFALACESSTHRKAQRMVRRRFFLDALQS